MDVQYNIKMLIFDMERTIYFYRLFTDSLQNTYETAFLEYKVRGFTYCKNSWVR